MHLVQDLDYLTRVQLFQEFPEDQLKLLAFSGEKQTAQADEIIFRQGQISTGGYVVMSGQIDLYINNDEKNHLVASYKEFSLVGEVSLISINRRIATAVANRESRLMHIPREVFTRMLNEYPELAILLHQRISASVTDLVEKIQQVQTRLEALPGYTNGNLLDQ